MHLQGRRVVVVKREGNTDLYYLAHSTEQADIRRLLLLYEYKDDLAPASRLLFLRAFQEQRYADAAEIFAKCSNQVIVSVEEFALDEASVNQGEAMEEVRLDIEAQIAEAAQLTDESLDAFKADEDEQQLD
jgi:hypothetical protein